MNIPDRERRDWSLIVFVVPIGILLIMIVGQLAARIVPIWSVNAGMNSNLDPNAENARPISLLPPLAPQILTPMSWAESFLTPMGEVSFPPFIIIEPSATPSPTPDQSTNTPATPTAIQTTVTPTTPSPSATTPVPTGETKTPNPTETEPTPTSTTGTPSATATTETPTPTATTETPTPTATTETPTPTPTTTGITSTPPAGTPSTPDPNIGVGELPDNVGPGDDNIGVVLENTYIIIQLSIEVGDPDGNYDLVFYEYNNGGTVYLDQIIIGITNDPTGGSFYQVFYWGDGDPDNNSNVGDVADSTDSENDNQPINVSELYDPDGAGPLPPTGILIDVDTAISLPPIGLYQYIVIIAPPASDEAQIDAIATVEVPISSPLAPITSNEVSEESSGDTETNPQPTPEPTDSPSPEPPPPTESTPEEPTPEPETPTEEPSTPEPEAPTEEPSTPEPETPTEEVPSEPTP